MSLPIEKATEDDIHRFYGGIEFRSGYHGRVMRKGKLVAAFGGVIESSDEGVWFGFLDVPRHLRKPTLYRHTLAVLNDAKASGAKVIRAACDTDIPRAREFMERLGFLPTEETIDGKVIFEWHP
ncbi:MAG: hypothetical protein ACTHJQ_25890 [Rhizobiaceae bacterium]